MGVMADYREKIKKYFDKEIGVIQHLDIEAINKVMNVIAEARQREATIYTMGNGGSAATASHFVCDFNKGISSEACKKFNLICLSDNTPIVTAIANDISYDDIFVLQLKEILKKDDLIIAISGSGNSKNIIKAVEYAKEIGAEVVGLTGYSGGKVLSKGDIVVYESTVYPGVTEEECLPVVEKVSGLKYNIDFFAGYSPERINPGDKEHTVEKIKKVTSGSTPETADIVDAVYDSVLVNGTHKAPTIKVAEASKIIENSQRDVNIAFMNELAKIFNAMGIDTNDVIEAASSKWNFIKLKPGLVGGHCISVDPYYLIQKAQVYGVLPRIMSAARRLNDGMGDYVANQVIKLMNKKGVLVKDSKILILGITFKENCPDIRNTKIVDIYSTLNEYSSNIVVYDPWADSEKVFREYGIRVINNDIDDLQEKFDAVVLGVAHSQFKNIDVRRFLSHGYGVVYDVKGVLGTEAIDGRL